MEGVGVADLRHEAAVPGADVGLGEGADVLVVRVRPGVVLDHGDDALEVDERDGDGVPVQHEEAEEGSCRWEMQGKRYGGEDWQRPAATEIGGGRGSRRRAVALELGSSPLNSQFLIR